MEILDMEIIENLRSLQKNSKRDLIEVLKGMYFETTPEAIQLMEDHLKNAAFEDLGREAHKLKSSSANMGAMQIADICGTIENTIVNCSDYTPEELSAHIQKIKDSLPETFGALDEVFQSS